MNAALREEATYSDLGLVLCIGRHRRRAALEEVYRRHAGHLQDLASRMCGPAQAHLVVGDVLLALWREPERFDPSVCSLRCFLLAHAHARAIEVVRSGRQGRGDRNVEPLALAELAGDDAWPVLSTLPEDERDAVALAWFGGYSCGELAHVLEQPDHVVKGRIRDGLNGLGRRRSLRGVSAR